MIIIGGVILLALIIFTALKQEFEWLSEMEKITDLETEERREAYEYAIATNEMEGVFLSPEDKVIFKALAERYAKGEITAKEFETAFLKDETI